MKRSTSTIHRGPSAQTLAGSGLAGDLTLVERSSFDNIEEYHRATVAHELGIQVDDVRHVSGYSSDVANYTYFQQLYDDLPIFNAVANVASFGDMITSLGTAFVSKDKPASSTPTLDFADAFSQSGAEQRFGRRVANGHANVRENSSATLGYIARRDGTLFLVYGTDVSNESERTMHRVFIDAHTGTLISAINYAADASYKAIPAIQLSPDSDFQVIVNPQDSAASPNGWHQFTHNKFTDSRGNNGVVYISYLTPVLAQETSSP
ncbi:hypothetical protein EST38_g8537 [Candolleomyces aberdarensis]|uniref:Extracellular metalloproteinase n=1 Tax=Candolleomyces aberdarensis TaxID=2316362 RepID=A0A4Q2DF48_9AGAR|nr:hypothetical protein EST38_g8537 [Candolleomyces aberdarensis]